MGTGSGNGNGPFDVDFTVSIETSGRGGDNPFESLNVDNNEDPNRLGFSGVNFDPGIINATPSPEPGIVNVTGIVNVGSQFLGLDPLNLRDDGVELSNDSIEALTNQYASLAFSLLKNRGLNPLRAEILGSLEFVPLSSGENIQSDESAISLNFGADLQQKQVNQIVRLIELHRIIRNSFVQLSSDMISNFTGFSSSELDLIESFYSYFISSSRINLIFEKALSGLSNNLISSLTFEETFERVYDVSKDYESIYENGLNPVVGLTPNRAEKLKILVKSNSLTSEKRLAVKAIIKKRLILSLFDEVQRFLKEIIDAKNYLLDSIDIKKLTNSDVTSFQNKSDGSNIERFLRSVTTTTIFPAFPTIDLATGIDNSSSRFSSNSVAFANILSNIYSTCLFFRNKTITPISSVEGNDNLIHFATLDSNSNNIRKGISTLKRIYPNHTSFMRTVQSTNKTHGNLSGFKTSVPGVNEDQSDRAKNVMDYSEGLGLKSSTISSIINLINPEGDIDTALADLLAYVCFDQVAGFNYRIDSNSDSKLDKQQIFPIRNLLSRILFTPDGFVGDSKSFYENYKDEQSSSVAGSTDSIFRQNRISTASENMFKAILKNRTSTLSQDPFAALEISHTLDEILFNGALASDKNGKTGIEVFLSDALLSGDTNLKDFKNFINEYESAYKNTLDKIVKFLGLDFTTDVSLGGHSPSDNDINLNNISNMNPANYFLFFMDVLGNDIYREDLETYDAINMMFFCEAGKDIDTMIKAFKSNFMGVLVSEPEASSLFCEYSGLDIRNKHYENLWDHYCESTDSVVKKVLNKVSGFTCKTYDRKYGINNDDNVRYTAVLSTNDLWISETKFEKSSSTTKAFGNADSEEFSTWTTANGLGHREDTKDKLREAIKIYNDDEKRTEHADEWSYPGGIRPSRNSRYLRRVMLNYPFSKESGVSLRGVPLSTSSNISNFGSFKDLFQNSFYGSYFSQTIINESDDSIPHELCNGGQFGGIFSTNMFQRAFLFYAFATRIFAKSTQVDFIINPNQNSAYIKRYDSTLRGIERALNGRTEPDFDNHNESALLAYKKTNSMLQKVLTKMDSIRREILRPFQVMGSQIEKMKSARDNLSSLFKTAEEVNRNNYTRYVAVKALKAGGFFNEANLTNASETGLSSIQKSIVNNFSSAYNLSSPHAFLPLDDQYIEEDVKIMYKVLTQKGFGFNSNEKLGRKNIFHVGIPFGMLEALRQMAYSESGESRYLSSNKIAIHIVKEDDLNPEIPFIPRIFVFDMDKFILPKTLNGVSNHILNYDDSDSFEQTLQKIEFLKRGESGLESYQIGAAWIPGPPITKSYTYNHVFDYYLKLYCKITTGLDFDEDVFKINASDVFDGSVDSSALNAFEPFQESLLQFYPSANVDVRSSIQFSRALNISKNSLFFTPMNRFKSAISFNCFERVFTFMINERDFIIPERQFGIEYKDIFNQDPVFNADPRQLITGLKYTPEEVQGSNVIDQTDGDSILRGKIDEYLRGLDQDSTHVSKYSIVISLL